MCAAPKREYEWRLSTELAHPEVPSVENCEVFGDGPA